MQHVQQRSHTAAQEQVGPPTAGFEPRRLFNVVQFVMNDKDSKGHVSLENAMQIMYLRYGRQALDAQLEEIFGTSDLNSGERGFSPEHKLRRAARIIQALQ